MLTRSGKNKTNKPTKQQQQPLVPSSPATVASSVDWALRFKFSSSRHPSVNAGDGLGLRTCCLCCNEAVTEQSHTCVVVYAAVSPDKWGGGLPCLPRGGRCCPQFFPLCLFSCNRDERVSSVRLIPEATFWLQVLRPWTASSQLLGSMPACYKL